MPVRHHTSGQLGRVGGNGVKMCASPPWSHHLVCAHVFFHITLKPCCHMVGYPGKMASEARVGNYKL